MRQRPLRAKKMSFTRLLSRGFVIIIFITLLACAGILGAALVSHFNNAHAAEPSHLSGGFLHALSANDVVVLAGRGVDYSRFVNGLDGDIAVAPLIAGSIDTDTAGSRQVVLSLSRGGQTTHSAVWLHVVEPVEYVVMEASLNTVFPEPRDFLRVPNICETAYFDVRLLTQINPAQVGDHPVQLSLGGEIFDSLIRVVDTTGPVVVLREVTIFSGQSVEALDFVEEIMDVSPVSVRFVNREPDIFTPGKRHVGIGFVDSHGNSIAVGTWITVLPNIEPPRIIGAADMESFVGMPVSFRQGVTAEDSFGNSLEFHVDTGLVNINVAGRYAVIFSATDSAGNRAEYRVYLTVLPTEARQVLEQVDALLAQILNDDMMQVQQARAIFNWVSANVSYAADRPRTCVYEGALQALMHRRGDCFVFYSISEVMLTRAGVPNMQVVRYGGVSNHNWNLINPDGMGWHHFDTTPIARMGDLNRFMFTASQAREFTERILRVTGHPNYFVYDTTVEVVY